MGGYETGMGIAGYESAHVRTRWHSLAPKSKMRSLHSIRQQRRIELWIYKVEIDLHIRIVVEHYLY